MYENTGTNATEAGKFTDGDLGAGIARSILGADFLNMILDELLGVVTSAGLVPSEADTGQVAKAIKLLAWPVGSIYHQYDGADGPSTLFGGTWLQMGGGRVLVGQDGTAEFLTVGQVGGEKTHELTEAEMPTHAHDVTYGEPDDSNPGMPGGTPGPPNTPEITLPTDETGGGDPHNNLQPYLTIKAIWRRTA